MRLPLASKLTSADLGLPLLMSKRVGLHYMSSPSLLPPVPRWNLIVSVNDPTLGTTDSTYPPGTYSIPNGKNVEVAAIATAEYAALNYWYQNGSLIPRIYNPYNFTMNENYTLEAVFIGGLTQFITNGGFETGDFTGWSFPPLAGYRQVVSTQSHSGTYSMMLHDDQTTGAPQTQVIATPPDVGSIKQFGFYYKGGAGVVSILFSDGSHSNVSWSAVSNWTYFNLLSWLQDSMLTHITFEANIGSYVYIDDVSGLVLL
jgi:hypothetical protein